MRSFMRRWNLRPFQVDHRDLTRRLGRRSIQEPIDMKIRRAMFMLSVAVVLATVALPARSQALHDSGDSSGVVPSTTTGQLDLTYVRPTQRTMIANYGFDAFGPYPIVGAGIAAGINQLSNAPPEWKQGALGYGKRFGSDFGIAAIGTTTRYGLSEAFREDAMYYRCECRGFLPRLRHAAISTLTARRGADGHHVFSFPALVSPYAGSMTAVYSWFPGRYGAKDAFRMGNYTMLGVVGENISLEFFYSGPHSLLTRMHLNNAHGSPEPGPNH
jgi:hypothetical protein